MKNLNWHDLFFSVLIEEKNLQKYFRQKSSEWRREKEEKKVINNSMVVDGAALHTIKLDKMRLRMHDYVEQSNQ